LVDLFEYMMMHGLTNPKCKSTLLEATCSMTIVKDLELLMLDPSCSVTNREVAEQNTYGLA
jgi:hypothetical protein